MSKSTQQRTMRAMARDHAARKSAGLLPLRRTWPISLCVGLALGSIIFSGDAVAGGPTGGVVVGGAGSIAQNGNSTVINQATQKLALNWQTFNLKADESVLFNQPSRSAVALNRILDQNPSQIFGKISSNGQIFLINTHGIIFGATAQLNVGSLMASTLDLTPDDFLSDHYKLNLAGAGAGAGIVNHGLIQAATGGSVSLVAGSVLNDGLIFANYGKINLDGAEHATLDFDGNGLINIQITGELKQRLDAKTAAVTNEGTLGAEGGTVVLQASATRDLFTNLVNNSGLIDASGISTDGGVVKLVGNGGNTINAGDIKVSGVRGGKIQLLSDHDVLVTGGVLDASGTYGGGEVLVGGDAHGTNLAVQNAAHTVVDNGVGINASATQAGDGGKVVVWSDHGTWYYGNTLARGGESAGNGGFVEVSGKDYLQFSGTADRRAPHGQAGMLLLDPTDLTITASGTSDVTCTLVLCATDAATSTLTTAALQTALAGGDVNVDATGGVGVGTGTIHWTDGSVDASAHSLTLTGTSITFDGTLTNVANLTFSGANPSGAGDATGAGSGTGSITGLGGMTFNLTGAKAGDAGGISFTKFIAADAATVSGAVGFDRTNSSTRGMKFVNATGVTGTGTVTGLAGDDTFTLSGTANQFSSSGITFTGFDTIVGNGGSDTLGGSGQTYNLTGANTGNSNGMAWTTIASLSDSGSGTFVFANAASVTGTISGGGTGMLDYSAYTTAVNVGLTSANTGTATGTGGFSGINAIKGGGSVGTVTGMATSDTFTLSGANAFSSSGIGFSNFDNIVGNGGSDTIGGVGQIYTLTDGTPDAGSSNAVAWYAVKNISDTTGTVNFVTSGSVSGNVAAQTLNYTTYGAPVAFNLLGTSGNATTGIGGTWTGVTSVSGNGTNATINGSGQTYTLDSIVADKGTNGTVTWTSFENLSDSAAGNFVFVDGASVSGTISGGGAGTLDYSAYTAAVDIGPTSANAGSATGTGGFSGINAIEGGGAAGTVTGMVTADTFTLNGPNAFSSSGIAFTAFDVINGNGGSDTIIGTGQTYTLAAGLPDHGSSNNVDWMFIRNIDDSTGTVVFDGLSGVTGNVTAKTLDYSTYISAVSFNLLGTGVNTTSGIGGTWTGVTTVIGNAANTGTVKGLVGGDTFTLSGTANAFASSGIAFTGFDTIIGNGGSDTISGTGQIYALTAGVADAGSSNNVTWSQLKNISDSTGTVDFGTGGSVTGNVTASTLDYSNYGSAVAFNLLGSSNTTSGIGGTWTGVTAVTGSSLADTISGNGQTYALDNVIADKGGNGTITWTSFENLSDSTGTIDFGTGGSVTGSVTASTLDYSNYGSAVAFNVLGTSSNTTSGIGGTWTGVTTVTGSAANGGTVTGMAGDDTFTLSGAPNAFASSGIVFAGFDTIIGNGGNDTIAGAGQTYALTAGTPDAGSSNGVTWSQLKNISDSTGTVDFGTNGSVTGDVTASMLNYGSYGSAVAFNLLGSSGTTSGIGGSWTGVTTVTGSSQADTISGSGQTYHLTGMNAGNNGSVGWTSFENLNDATSGTFVFSAGMGVSGTIAGSAGTLDYSAYTGAVNVDLGGAATNIGGGWSGITTFKGGAASDTINGNNQAFNLTGANVGNNGVVNWSSFENLTDGTSGQFNFGNGGSVSGILDGGGAGTLDYSGYTTAVNVGLGGTATATGGWVGIISAQGGSASDTISGNSQTYNLTGMNDGNSGGFAWTSFENIADTGTGTLSALNQVWSLTGHDQGTVSNLAGAFSGIGNLIDTGTGRFFMHDGADGDISGNLDAGTDGLLDYTGYTTPVTVNISGAGTTGVGGTTSGVSVLAASSSLAVTGNASGNLAITTTGTGSGTSFGTTTVGGDLQVVTTGPVSQSGGALIVAGTSNIDAGTNSIALLDGGNDFTGAVTLNGGATQISDINALRLGNVNSTTLSVTSGDLTIAGAVTGTAVNLTSSGTITEDAAGVITADTLTGSSAAGTMLANANAIGALGGFTASGFALNNAQSLTVAGPVDGGASTALTVTAGDLTINGALSGTQVTFTSAGAINEGVGGVITAAELNGSSLAGTTLGGANKIGALGSFTAVNFALSNAQSLTVTGPVNGGANTTLTTTAGDLSVNGAVNGTTITLTSAGAISEGAGGLLAANTLKGSSVGNTALNTANQIGALGSFTAANLALTNAQSLAINGPVDGGASTMLKTTTGNLAINGSLTGAATTLTSAGAISEGAGGLITANTLKGSSTGATTLNGANKIGAVGSFTAVNLALTNAQSLAVTGPVNGGASTSLKTTTGNLAVNGAVIGATTTLTSAGTISEGAGGVITADTLKGSSVGSTTLNGANKVAMLGSFTAANFALTNAQSLTVTGPINGGAGAALKATAGDLAINGAVNGTTTTLTSAGDISEGTSGVITANLLNGSSVGDTTLGGANRIAALGSFSAANLALVNTQSLTLDGPVNGGANTALTTTAGDLAINGSLTGTTMTLTLAGAISEGAGGVITANTLNGSSVGATMLNGANKVGTLGSFTAANFALTNVQSLAVTGPVNGGASTMLATSAGNLAINGAVTGTTTTLTSAGAISEGAGGLITANTLKGSSAGGTALGGANKIAALGGFSAANLALTNAQSLVVDGPVDGGATAALTTTAGNLTINGALNGAAITLTSAGAISEGAGGVLTANMLKGSSAGSTTLEGANKVGALGSFTAANFALTNVQSLTLAGPINGGANTTLRTTAGNLAINGVLNGVATTLVSAGAISEGAAGVITANTLKGSSAGAATLNGANKIGTLGSFTAANFALTNTQSLAVAGPVDGGASTMLKTTAGDLSINGVLRGTTTTLASAGTINQGAGGVIATTLLTGSSVGDTTLGGANKIGTLGSFTAANFTLTNAQSLALTGLLDGGASTTLTTTVGDLAINGALTGTTVALTSAGAISEGAGGNITAGLLTGSSAGNATLDGANHITRLGSFTSDFSLTNNQTLTVVGPLDGGPVVALTTTVGDLVINGTINGATTTLTSAGAITEGAGGAITADTLTGSSAGETTLNGANRIGALGSFKAHSFALTNAQTLAVTGPVDGGASTTLKTTAGDLAINGAVSGTTTTLASAGAISEGAGGAITAHTLKGSSAGDATLNGANHIGTLGSFTAANFALTNAQSLALTGPVNGGTSTALKTTTGDLTINGALKGTTITLTSAGAITEGAAGVITADTLTGSSTGATSLGGANLVGTLGSFSAANFALTNARSLTTTGPVNGGASTTLATTAGDLAINGAVSGNKTTLISAGAITEGSNGVITADTLSGVAAGPTTLGSAAGRISNMVGTLGNFASTAGFSMTNNRTLTLASVDGSAFTVNAGKSPTYLSVTNGDLFQVGLTPLYNSTGTWGSTGRMGKGSAPIQVIGTGIQTIANVGLPPAYFYAVDSGKRQLPLVGGFAINVPTAQGAGSAQNGNHGDSYIDPSVVSANYRSYGIVPSGVRLPADQQSGCDPDQPDQEGCQDDDSVGMVRFMMNGGR